MDPTEFRQAGREMVDYLATYMETLASRRVTPEVEPGYLRNLLPSCAPATAEPFSKILKDVDRAIMPGITHWQHPNFHAYFPAGNSFPSVLGDMLSDVIGCIGFSWAASPACTELEVLMCDWVGKMIGLPRSFLHEGGEGGGVIQGSASECVLVTLLAARHAAIKKLKVRLPFAEDGSLLSKLVAYSSKLAHSCLEKAGMIGFVKMRQLEVDDDFSLRGHVLENAIEEDRRLGLIPFYVCATLGTTACCSFDSVSELGEVCAREGIWLHVDAAYAGNALICPEFQYLIKGIECCNSLNFNCNKWMQVNFDCSLMWVHDVDTLTSALTVDPLYLQHKHENKAIDLRHWGIPLSRRFRALKLWFVLRMYGVQGLQRKIREQIELAHLFEEKVLEDERFEVHGNVTMGLVCFRLQGPNTLSIRLLKMINESGKLHMVPALLNELYVIRFAICSSNASRSDVIFAWGVISASATELLAGRRASSSGGEHGAGGLGGGGGGRSSFESISESDDEVFNTDFDDEFIFDHQRCHVRRAHMQRNLFFKMVSDPKSYNPRVSRSLSGRLRSHSQGSPAGTPGSTIPSSVVPSAGTSGSTTPFSVIPSAGTSGSTTPSSVVPSAGTSGSTAPSSGIPSAGTSGSTTPSSVVPTAGTSGSTTPSSVVPSAGNHGSTTPSSEVPIIAGTPESTTPSLVTPGSSTPSSVIPIVGTPGSTTLSSRDVPGHKRVEEEGSQSYDLPNGGTP